MTYTEFVPQFDKIEKPKLKFKVRSGCNDFPEYCCI